MMQPKGWNGHLAPALTADAILLKGAGDVLLIRRKDPPFAGAWALPGGFVDVGESVEDAARRELLEETGLRGDIVDLLSVYSDPRRDPRGHTVTVAFVMRVGGLVQVEAGDDAAEARWFPMDALPPLAFDHDRILADARRWLATPGNAEKLADNDVGKCA
jgi:8-oxo-dGTP diphosphatase